MTDLPHRLEAKAEIMAKDYPDVAELLLEAAKAIPPDLTKHYFPMETVFPKEGDA